ncbi:unnamed protein product [marine sediment metagenome]|uniref:Uncharacterized protein n=1 Tax=marine sediment metagenome TaxID=412755 RepID=X0UD25_9ZZZZ
MRSIIGAIGDSFLARTEVEQISISEKFDFVEVEGVRPELWTTGFAPNTIGIHIENVYLYISQNHIYNIRCKAFGMKS